jgi:osmotically-inducible protein OsmY
MRDWDREEELERYQRRYRDEDDRYPRLGRSRYGRRGFERSGSYATSDLEEPDDWRNRSFRDDVANRAFRRDMPSRTRSYYGREEYRSGEDRDTDRWQQTDYGYNRENGPHRTYRGAGYGEYDYDNETGGGIFEPHPELRERYSSQLNYSATGRRFLGREGHEDRDRRSWWERVSDEVASWFGDEEAARRRKLDEIRESAHRGKGPRNYRRSDERIMEDINDRLTESVFLDASDVEVQVANAEVVLTGNVQDRYSKHVAGEIAERVSGVRNVENRLRVSSSLPAYSTAAGTTPGTTEQPVTSRSATTTSSKS